MSSGPRSSIHGLAAEPRYSDPAYSQPFDDFRRSELYQRWDRHVRQTDNDFIVVIAAASKSAISGVGKTTLAIELARWFDDTGDGFDAGTKATLSAKRFARDMLGDPDAVADRSAVIFDEGQGTLHGDGIDSRRSMAGSVMDVTTALSTMRFRQLTPIIVSQSTDWIDKRINDLLDALVLIQPSDSQTIRANIYETYQNDFENGAHYTERMSTLTWDPLPSDDPDYRTLHEMKERSATDSVEEFVEDDEDEEGRELTREQQLELAQYLRDQGNSTHEISESPLITYSQTWITRNTEGES